MASSFPEPDRNDLPEEGEPFPWPEMDMIENIIMDIRDYIKENGSGAHISIDIDFKSVSTSTGRIVSEKYSVGAVSTSDDSIEQQEENKEIDELIVVGMENAIPSDKSHGILTLPPELSNASMEEQVKYIAEKIRQDIGKDAAPQNQAVGLNDSFFSFDRLMELKKRNESNGKQ